MTEQQDTDIRDELTDEERRIAREFGNVLDMACRLMLAGGISQSYFYEKFTNLVRSAVETAEHIGVTPGEIQPKPKDRPSWDLDKVWQAVVKSEAFHGSSLDQVWTAIQYENPYYGADYPPGGPYFRDRPHTLDDPNSAEWHVQYLIPGDQFYKATTVRAHGPSDAVRNTRYLHPAAEDARIDLIEHPEAAK